MKVVLIGTWLMLHQPPVPFQVEFNSVNACKAAAQEIMMRFEQGLSERGRLMHEEGRLRLVTVCAERE